MQQKRPLSLKQKKNNHPPCCFRASISWPPSPAPSVRPLIHRTSRNPSATFYPQLAASSSPAPRPVGYPTRPPSRTKPGTTTPSRFGTPPPSSPSWPPCRPCRCFTRKSPWPWSGCSSPGTGAAAAGSVSAP